MSTEVLEGIRAAILEFRRRVEHELRPGETLLGDYSLLLEEGARDEVAGGRLVESMIPEDGLCSLVHHVEPREPRGTVYGVDGSSRSLDSVEAMFAAFSAGVAHYKPGLGASVYPPDGRAYLLPLVCEKRLSSGGSRLEPLAPVMTAAPLHVVPDMPYVRRRPLIDPELLLTERSSICGGNGDCEERLARVARSLYYGYGYDIHTMLDENRIYLENLATAYLAAAAGGGYTILLDGPVFNTPGLFVQMSGGTGDTVKDAVRAFYALTYLLLVLSRIRIVAEALGKDGDARIAGFVKRLGRSRLLSRALGMDAPDDRLAAGIARKCGSRGITVIGPVVTLVDLQEVYNRILAKLGLIGLRLNPLIHIDDPAYIIVSEEPLKTIRRRLSSCDDRLYENASIHPGDYGRVAKRSYYIVAEGVPAVYRVELPCLPFTECVTIRGSEAADANPARDLASGDMELVSWLLWLSVHTDTGVPLPIHVADHYAKSATRLLTGMVFELLNGIVHFRYESLLEAAGQ